MKRPHKFGAVRVEIDGHTFASKAEAKRYGELKLLERAGEISALVLQPALPCEVNGVKVCKYVADFAYRNTAGALVIEDVKGFKTDVYRLKRKLVKALHGIDVTEVQA